MIYCTSDLHGIPVPQFNQLLEQASFSDSDFLFVLGDVIDRGAHGVELLQDLALRPNAELLLGNHEAMLLSCQFLFQEITDASIAALDHERMGLLSTWLSNGAEPTMRALRQLYAKDPEQCLDLLDFLRDAPLYETVSAGGKDFLLCHAGLGEFRADKKLSQYTDHQWLWTRPDLTDRYFDHVITVFGHTPTRHYGAEYAGKVIQTDSWINIDTSPAPCLLRLDDLTAFYIK